MSITISEATQLASIIGVLITVIALLFTVLSFKKQLQLHFFSEYTKRYQEIVLNFPVSFNADDFDYGSLKPDDRDKALRYVRAYFDLCSEEYFLKRKGHIDIETWKEWEAGMRLAFSKTAFLEAWEILQLDSTYYSEFAKFVHEIMPNSRNKLNQQGVEKNDVSA
jgi:hypothetical protein